MVRLYIDKDYSNAVMMTSKCSNSGWETVSALLLFINMLIGYVVISTVWKNLSWFGLLMSELRIRHRNYWQLQSVLRFLSQCKECVQYVVKLLVIDHLVFRLAQGSE